MWKRRLDYVNSNDMSGSSVSVTGDYYDRRHLCTFYSFDRPLPTGNYPELDTVIETYAIANWAVAGYANAAEYKEYLWGLWGPIFVPKGTATTNIETPLAVDGLGNSVPYNNVETRRKILHLLYAFRAYYLEQGDVILVAAKKSAQIVANIIDFSDGNFDASGVSNLTGPVGDNSRDYGPFYDGASDPYDYGSQNNLDCTFINKDIIDKMIDEVGAVYGVTIPAAFDFGLPAGEVVFGYERQPFISEVYAARVSGTPTEFAIELVNPYSYMIDLTGWKVKVGSYSTLDTEFDGLEIPASESSGNLGRLIIYSGAAPGSDSITTLYGVDYGTRYHPVVGMPLTFTTGDCKIILTRNAPAGSGEAEIVVDAVQGDDYNKDVANTIFQDGQWSSVRKDSGWSFVKPDYAITNTTSIGSANDPNNTTKAFQLAVPNDGEGVSRWGDIEVLSLYGNPSFDIDPNNPITVQIEADPNGATFDLLPTEDADILEYVSPMNRPDKGSLPGRININTAPLHVIAAALPPNLIRLKNDPNTAVDVAQMIIDKRPYTNIGQLLDLDFFTRLADDDDNIAFTNGVGDDQNIKDDIEERDWFMTYLANKFTVRSDTFTAYILVRLGAEGPQRRMIGIFDRSQVWDKNDRPKLVALHPVPDPR
jgi:hypothetical protein